MLLLSGIIGTVEEWTFYRPATHIIERGDDMPRAYTENRKKNNQKWDAQNLDRVSIAMPKGKKDEIKAAAAAAGESMNQFINAAIDERLEKGISANPEG